MGENRKVNRKDELSSGTLTNFSESCVVGGVCCVRFAQVSTGGGESHLQGPCRALA